MIAPALTTADISNSNGMQQDSWFRSSRSATKLTMSILKFIPQSGLSARGTSAHGEREHLPGPWASSFGKTDFR